MNKIISLVCVLKIILFPLTEIHSQDKFFSRNLPELPAYLINNHTNDYRKIINLNGEWEVLSSEQKTYKIQVPFCYNGKGTVHCSRYFDLELENPLLWNYILVAQGINYQAEVKINGNFIVKHEGGFTPFSSVIPNNIIREKNNLIEIIIDNTLSVSRTIPLKNSVLIPQNYGGIYRDIYIIAVPSVFIKAAHLASEIDINLNSDITCNVVVSSTDISEEKTSTYNINVEILDTSGNLKSSATSADFSIPSNSTVPVQLKFTFNSPSFWSPDNPYLYKVRVKLLRNSETIDMVNYDYGISDVSYRSNQIYIGQKEFRFKGINYIEEFTDKGICGSYGDTEEDVKKIKNLGANIIKVYGRPASEYLLELCSRYGIWVMEEIPVYNVPATILGTENFLTLAENQFTEMIRAHRNYPCIFAYGMGNDFEVTGPEAAEYVKRLRNAAKLLDNKIVYYSTRNYYYDKCRQYADMTGINFYNGDLNYLKNILLDIKIKNDRIFISNFGKIINPDNVSGGYSDPSSNESLSKFIVDVYKLTANSSLRGAFLHSFSDWKSDMSNTVYYRESDQNLITTGIFNLQREQRPPSVILRKVFLNEDIPNLNIGSYSKQQPVIFVFIGLGTFILFIYLANSVRRFRDNVSRALIRPFIFFTDVREQNLIPANYNTILLLILSVSSGLFFANLIYYWRDSDLFNIILGSVFINEKVKLRADQIINSPLKLTLALTLLLIIKMYFTVFIIWLFSLTLKYRVQLNNIYSVVVWGFLPLISLLIAGSFYLRILSEMSDFVYFGLGFAVIVYILSLYRIFKGVSVIFDVFYLKSYIYGLLTTGIIIGTALYYINHTRHTIDYLYLILSFLKG